MLASIKTNTFSFGSASHHHVVLADDELIGEDVERLYVDGECIQLYPEVG
jgi:hypothetical protein